MQSQNTISYNCIPMFPKEVIKMNACFHICLHCKLIIKMKEKILIATMICVIVPKRVSLLNSVKTTKITNAAACKKNRQSHAEEGGDEETDSNEHTEEPAHATR